MCASRWSFTKNHYMMHGQQYVKLSGFVQTILKFWFCNKAAMSAHGAGLPLCIRNVMVQIRA